MESQDDRLRLLGAKDDIRRSSGFIGLLMKLFSALRLQSAPGWWHSASGINHVHSIPFRAIRINIQIPPPSYTSRRIFLALPEAMRSYWDNSF
ncbi:hypothetical protein EYZ11_004845 [Aspergillus tanneri]|uniref:Uncharacterized protein n=1 Tax=Aspergillus tanneri TaxID=1220188 RepID=A0A4S3JLV4_9EURO|nr:hypothetical protein EYZ11_004845 [Aspergillus tanneri]